jgi:hypothetical protein
MWTLLCALESDQGRATDAGAEPLQTTPMAAHAGANGTPVLNGAAATVPKSGKVRIFMCPGRTEIGVMDLKQAVAQFDFGVARRFRSLSEADPVCTQTKGFLLELLFGGSSGQACDDAAVLFVEGLRG